jgi:N6-L-threonylcarbamoyladenine synthase
VTYGPGLIGSLLIGVETAKTLALTWQKPLIPINHLIGHFYANWIGVADSGWQMAPSFPIIGLLVSGGHTDLVLFTDHNKYQYLGGTRDDAAGECFDKCARLLGLPYPGGPEISQLAKSGDGSKIKLPKPMLDSGDFDFSFSGLKTAVSNLVSEELRRTQKTRNSEDQTHRNSDSSGGPSLSESFRSNLATALQQTIVEVLVRKTVSAVRKSDTNQIMIAGGVAANSALSEALRSNSHVRVFSPSHNIFCTDNAAMIAAAGFFTKKRIDPLKLQASPNLGL